MVKGTVQKLVSAVLAVMFMSGQTLPVMASTKDVGVGKDSSVTGFHEPKVVNTEEYFNSSLPVSKDVGVHKAQNPLPSSYKSQYNNEIRDQGSTEACESYAYTSCMENSASNKTHMDNDYSVRHLAWFSAHKPNGLPGFGRAYNETDAPYAESSLDIIGSLTKWDGMALESKYQTKPETGYWYIPENYRHDNVAHMQDAYFLERPYSNGTLNNSAIDKIKQAIIDNGAVHISVRISDNDNDTSRKTNHSMTIVGWDDNYKKENFKTQYYSDGAWLCKNSYGSATLDDGSHVAENGYMHVSYFDKIADNFVVVNADPMDSNGKFTYDNIYLHDNIGVASNTSYTADAASKSGAAVYKVKGNETLRAVSAVTTKPGASVHIDVYRLNSNYNSPIDGDKITSQVTYEPYRGYHTIDIGSSYLGVGETVSVVETVKYADGTSDYPIEVDKCNLMNDRTSQYGWNYSESQSAGNSFVCYKGVWRDTTNSAFRGMFTNSTPGAAMIRMYTKSFGSGDSVCSLSGTVDLRRGEVLNFNVVGNTVQLDSDPDVAVMTTKMPWKTSGNVGTWTMYGISSSGRSSDNTDVYATINGERKKLFTVHLIDAPFTSDTTQDISRKLGARYQIKIHAQRGVKVDFLAGTNGIVDTFYAGQKNNGSGVDYYFGSIARARGAVGLYVSYNGKNYKVYTETVK